MTNLLTSYRNSAGGTLDARTSADWRRYYEVSEIESGEELDLSRMLDIQMWRDYYLGRLAPLFWGTPTKDNGLLLVPYESMQSQNWFAVLSRFYSDAVLHEHPSLEPEPPDEFLERLWATLSHAIIDWSFADRGVVYRMRDGAIASLPVEYYIPIVDERNPDEIVAHVFFVPYQSEPTTAGQADRVRITRFDERRGINEVQSFEFHGVGQVGSPVDAAVRSDVEAVWTFGDDQSFYPAISQSVREIHIREGMATKVLNNHTQPKLMAPPALANQIQLPRGVYANQAGLDDPATPDPFDPATGGVIRGEEGGGWAFLTYDAQMTENNLKLQRLVNFIHLASGVPPTSFGVDIGRGESGIARERAMTSAVVKIGRYRMAMKSILQDLLGAGVEVEWARSPLQDQDEHDRLVLDLYAGDILDRDEVRMHFGYPPMEEVNHADTDGAARMGDTGQAPSGGDIDVAG